VTEWTVDLPYRTPPLSLNHRLHRMAEYRIKKQLKDDAIKLARYNHLPVALPSAHIQLNYRPPTAGRHDEDNLMATLKPLIDGLVSYGLVLDDRSEVVSADCKIVRPAQRPGTMWLTITLKDEN
jgi:crossover junction endodeoxyribonuclease RusA